MTVSEGLDDESFRLVGRLAIDECFLVRRSSVSVTARTNMRIALSAEEIMDLRATDARRAVP